MLQVTPAAQGKIADLLNRHSDPELALRISVVGGGCSGFQYDMAFDKARDEDEVLNAGPNVRVLVDPMSYRYLEGTELDFVESIQGSGFSFQNPNAKRTCGCGKSFAG